MLKLSIINAGCFMVVTTVFIYALLSPGVIHKLKLWTPIWMIEKIFVNYVLGMSENWNQVAQSVENSILFRKYACFIVYTLQIKLVSQIDINFLVLFVPLNVVYHIGSCLF